MEAIKETSQTTTTAPALADAIADLRWRTALPADGMPAHQYVVQKKAPMHAWDVLGQAIRDEPSSYDAYFRGYTFAMHYWEFEGHRYWRTSGSGGVHMLNRCTLDSVEPPRRVDEGAEPMDWEGPPWAPNGTPWPPGFVPGPGPSHMRGMVYRKEDDPRQGFPCRSCGRSFWLYEPERPCPRCDAPPALADVQDRGLA